MSTTVFRVEKDREYVVMNNKFLREKNMSLKAKGLLALCLSLPDTWNYSINGLVAICKESQTSIRSALKELEQFGHLKRNRKKDDKGQFIYEYVIYESPYAGFVYAGNQSTENGRVENAHAENVRQESKEEESIKKEIKEEENIEDIYRDVLSSIENLELKQLYKDYIEMRKTINSPLSKRGLIMIIQRCKKLSDSDIETQKALLETAIIHNWKNVYSPREENLPKNVRGNDALNKLREFYL